MKKTVEGMNEHVEINHHTYDMVCAMCDERRETFEEMYEHIETNHKGFEGEHIFSPLNLYCLLCEAEKTTEKEITEHIVNNHDRNEYVSKEKVEHGCRICTECAATREARENTNETSTAPRFPSLRVLVQVPSMEIQYEHS